MESAGWSAHSALMQIEILLANKVVSTQRIEVPAGSAEPGDAMRLALATALKSGQLRISEALQVEFRARAGQLSA